MKTVILCGGMGTRLTEETVVRPKPLVTVGTRPILWHIMKGYASYGFNEFILALGYKGDKIKEYFLNYNALSSDMEIDLSSGQVNYKRHEKLDWKIQLVETGEKSMTGGRLLRLKPQLSSSTFMVTYGDGVSNVDIKKLLEFHKNHGRAATVTAVRPLSRFGGMNLDSDRVSFFKEKPKFGDGWINGGFFIFEPKIFDYLADDSTVLEQSPLENLARDNQLMAYRHEGYWQCMDTIRDRQVLEEDWQSGEAPWKTWADNLL